MNALLSVLAFCAFSMTTHAKEIALTFDDSPRHARGYLSGPKRAQKLIRSLKESGVGPAVFFSVSSQVEMSKERRARLQSYADAGHIIANHTHIHPNFNNTSLETYKANFLIADERLSRFPNYKKWFRFPYLREGNTQKKRNGMRKMLKDRGYRNVYITVNNYDWYIETLFQRAVKSQTNFDFERMRKFYVKTLMQAVDYYDEIAKKYLGRSPKHILLLHEMDITALFIGDLLRELRNKGWKIISTEEALEDPISNYETARILSYNPGRISEIAADKGLERSKWWHKTCDEAYLDKAFRGEVLSFKEKRKSFKHSFHFESVTQL